MLNEKAIDLTKNYKKTLRELRDGLLRELGNSLDSLVLYGSVARKDFHHESDIDVLLVVENRKLGEKALDIRYEIDLKNGTFTTVFLATPQELEGYLRRGSPFLENVIEEGEVLYDNGTWERIRGSLARSLSKKNGL